MKKSFRPALLAAFAVYIFVFCTDSVQVKSAVEPPPANKFGGFASKEKWGEHIVTIAACHDCHTPKIMTPFGPDFDSSRLLSGHPAGSVGLSVNRSEMEKKGYTVTGDLTEWVGPWGVSYAANLTSDSTGIGGWKEEQFIYAIRNGKLKGLPHARNILPPMPWTVYKFMTDDELKAIYAYLKTTKPIKNVVPAPKPPVAAVK
jgi:mono/diheme cytochrome c family protein